MSRTLVLAAALAALCWNRQTRQRQQLERRAEALLRRRGTWRRDPSPADFYARHQGPAPTPRWWLG